MRAMGVSEWVGYLIFASKVFSSLNYSMPTLGIV